MNENERELKIILTGIGVALLEDIGEQDFKLSDFVQFGKTPEICAERYHEFEHKFKFSELTEILQKYESTKLASDQKSVVEFVRKKFPSSIDIVYVDSEKLKAARSFLRHKLVEKKIFRSLNEETAVLREVAMHLSRLELREPSEARDVYVGQAINAIDDLTKTFNLLANRLFEWYGTHFPELMDLMRDNVQYIRLIAEQGPRSNFDEESIQEVSEKRREQVISSAKDSLGTDLTGWDLGPIQRLARLGLEINKAKEELEEYIDSSMKEVAPNIQKMVGSLIGARLIALAGSLRSLALKPSSTVQVLGAEKALFRHLKTGDAPPKHGILFQSPMIHNAPAWQRGKISRALANKLSLAARVDFFSGELVADELSATLEERIKEIQRNFPTAPPPKKVKPKKDRRKRKSRGKPQRKHRKGSREKKRKKY